jgi:hypothetical protein
MKIEVKLITTRSEKVEGFPLIIEISHRNIRKQNDSFCHEKHLLLMVARSLKSILIMMCLRLF